MEELPRVAPFPAGPGAIDQTPHARVLLLAPSDPPPADTDALIPLADGSRIAYVPRAPGGPATELKVDPFLRGNAFEKIHESPRALAALLSIAAARRMDAGADSERVFVFLRGAGLLSLENGDVHRFEPNTLAIVPAGFAARLWAQGPEDVLAVVLQPRGVAAQKRTLASEIAKQRHPGPGPGPTAHSE